MRHSAGQFGGFDGARLFRQTWMPEPILGCGILLIHRFGDHSGRYAELASVLVEDGHGVFAFDLRGHGRSEGARGHVDRWADYRKDVACFLETVQQEIQGRPLVFLGHSMGGLIVLDFLFSTAREGGWVASSQDALAGIILSAPLLEPPELPRWRFVLAGLLSRLWPTFSMRAGIDPRNLSQERADQEDYERDPLVHGIGSARLAAELLGAVQWVRMRAPAIDIPTLICHASGDRIVPVKGSRSLAKAAPDGMIRLQEYPVSSHELHHDSVRNAYFADVRSWLHASRTARGA